MKCNPYIDQVLPVDAPESRIRAFWKLSYPPMPPDQKEYARAVLLTLAELPEDIRQALRA